MRLRLVVIAVFVTAAAVPALIAGSSGLLSRPESASAGIATDISPEHRVAPLAWPDDPLQLAAGGDVVAWEERTQDKSAAGVWAYDVRTRTTRRIISPASLGAANGRLSMSGSLVVWSAWEHRRRQGAAGIEAYDKLADRRWRVASQGLYPAVSRTTVIWAERRAGATRRDDAVRGTDSLTDRQYSVEVEGRIKDLATSDGWASWVSGPPGARSVWAADLDRSTRYLLAAIGTAVAMDDGHIVWATRPGTRACSLVLWNRRSSHSVVLCRVRGVIRDISLSADHATWVTMRHGLGRVWIYDFARGRAFPLTAQPSEQASPVLLGDAVFWADRRSGSWELYERSLLATRKAPGSPSPAP